MADSDPDLNIGTSEWYSKLVKKIRERPSRYSSFENAIAKDDRFDEKSKSSDDPTDNQDK